MTKWLQHSLLVTTLNWYWTWATGNRKPNLNEVGVTGSSLVTSGIDVDAIFDLKIQEHKDYHLWIFSFNAHKIVCLNLRII